MQCEQKVNSVITKCQNKLPQGLWKYTDKQNNTSKDKLTDQNKYQAVFFLYHLLNFLEKFRNLTFDHFNRLSTSDAENPLDTIKISMGRVIV